jgi:hypothetical protein
MKRLVWVALSVLCGCGWQPAGGSNPVPATPLTVRLVAGHSTTITLPAEQPGETRSATSTAPLVATAAIDGRGNLSITGISAGDATITEIDTLGTTATRSVYDVQVIP